MPKGVKGFQPKEKQVLSTEPDTTDYAARIAELEAQNAALTAQIENAGAKVALPPGVGTRRLVGYVRARPEDRWIPAQMIVDADIYKEQFINKCDKRNLDQRIVELRDGEDVVIKGFPAGPPTIVGAMDYARTGTE